jgi:hypothetical protein
MRDVDALDLEFLDFWLAEKLDILLRASKALKSLSERSPLSP